MKINYRNMLYNSSRRGHHGLLMEFGDNLKEVQDALEVSDKKGLEKLKEFFSVYVK